MSTYPSFVAGDEVTAKLLNDMQTVAVVATAAQSVNNSTTLTDDTSLIIPVAANGKYLIEMFLIFQQSGTGNADLKTDWNFPAGSTGLKQAIGPTNGTAFTDRTNTAARIGGHLFNTAVVYNLELVASRPTAIIETGIINVGDTSGNVRVRFAQNTAVAQNVTRNANSFVRATRYQ